LKAVILAGGLGTRLREETEYRPKPMVEIGEKPILWHIMKNLSSNGFHDFILCLGYKGEQIKDFFLNYDVRLNDSMITIGKNNTVKQINKLDQENWKVILANTGLHTMTGGRIFKVRDYVQGETFLCTYGDGLANINITKLLEFHKSHGKIATVTAVQPTSRFGTLEIDTSKQVKNFSEKPKSEQWINGGFFVFEPRIFEYLDSESTLEKEPLENLAKNNELMAFQHTGFWQPMDTYRETQELNDMWNENIAPWKTW
jgi:glucose-1-phosphate cytidylyltransferase